jgi:hypothetical protein
MRFLLILILICFSGWLLAQPIYKVVDEEGNVTYTDQKPDESADPLDLPEINVLDRGEEEAVIAAEPEAAEPREHLEFIITSPRDDEVLDSDSVTVAIESSVDLPPTTQVVIYLNDIAQPPVQSLAARYEGIGGGEHSLRAELQTPSGRVLAETEAVSFTVSDATSEEPPR